MAIEDLTFSPNTNIVEVLVDGVHQGYYEVYSVNGYIGKCRAEGKQCIWMGCTNSEGKIEGTK